MTDLIFPTNIELNEIAAALVPRLTENRPVFEIFPMVDVDSHVVMWEQQDNYVGLQQIRGYDSKPQRVKNVGGKRYLFEPGVYGEWAEIAEFEITARRSFGAFAGTIDVTDLVMRRQAQLLQRRLDRIEKIVWDLLSAGTFSVSTAEGTVLHTDTYAFQTATVAVNWATVATATPIADFRAVQLLGRGKGVSFGSQATAWMNLITATKMLNNQNAADLFGHRLGLGTLNNLSEVNQILSLNGLPQIRVYDEGYVDDASTFHSFIPDERVVIVGSVASGSPIGQYSMTRNANNPGVAPGPYMKTIDNINDVPRTIEVHDGHNGGPEIHYPSAVVVLDTTP